MEKSCLTNGEKQLLKILYKSRKPFTIDKIAVKMKESFTHVATLMDWLLSKGYVTQTRRGYFKITTEAKNLLVESKELLRGSVIGKRYVLQEFLGEGGYGAVWKALDKKVEKRIVAVKLIHKRLEGIELLKREANALAQSQKPDSILVFHDVGYDRKRGWLVTEFIEAPTLHKYLQSMAINKRWLLFEEAKQIVEQCLEAVAFAHSRQVVHGDIKPANIFILKGAKIKLSDFGVARILDKTGKEEESYSSKHKVPLGSPTFLAPEVLKGELPDFQADLFSIGILAYLLFTGQHPFLHTSGLISIPELIMSENYMPTSPSELKRDIPEKYANIIMGLLEKDKKIRKEKYENAENVLNKWLK